MQQQVSAHTHTEHADMRQLSVEDIQSLHSEALVCTRFCMLALLTASRLAGDRVRVHETGERGREGERQRERQRVCVCVCRLFVCVCVCVRASRGERSRECLSVCVWVSEEVIV